MSDHPTKDVTAIQLAATRLRELGERLQAELKELPPLPPLPGKSARLTADAAARIKERDKAKKDRMGWLWRFAVRAGREFVAATDAGAFADDESLRNILTCVPDDQRADKDHHYVFLTVVQHWVGEHKPG